jgi:hypothetical protein
MDHFFATIKTYGGDHSSRGGIARRGHAGAADLTITARLVQTTRGMSPQYAGEELN